MFPVKNEHRSHNTYYDTSMSYSSLFTWALCVLVCDGADAWEPAFSTGQTRITEYPSEVHRPQLSSGFPLTVKDLLLSGTAEAVSVSWLGWEFDSLWGWWSRGWWGRALVRVVLCLLDSCAGPAVSSFE